MAKSTLYHVKGRDFKTVYDSMCNQGAWEFKQKRWFLWERIDNKWFYIGDFRLKRDIERIIKFSVN